jgi:hypothetical protein
VRVGTSEFQACCLKCGNVFLRVEEKPTLPPSPLKKARSGWKQGVLDWLHQASEVIPADDDPFTTATPTLPEEEPPILPPSPSM